MGIQFYNGLSNYNSYRVDIPKVTPDDVRKQDEELKNSNNPATLPVKEETLSPSQIKKIDERSATADLEDISLSFNKEESYDYIGKDAPIKSLDMQKAISDMKKDDILQDYNYFVGSSKNLFTDDGIVMAK